MMSTMIAVLRSRVPAVAPCSSGVCCPGVVVVVTFSVVFVVVGVVGCFAAMAK